ncbi:MAG: hypothetical protein ACNS63_10765 [Candidatus Nitrospinota bacterium M3_3B_026]
MTVYEICDRCGVMIAEGAIRYVVRLVVAADDGGVVSEPITDMEMDEIIQRLEEADAAELERNVFEEREYILCPRCKREFLKNPLRGGPEGGFGRGRLMS